MPTVTKIEIYKLNIPRETPFRIAIGVFDEVQNILVRVQASDGVYGLGEGAPLPFLWNFAGSRGRCDQDLVARTAAKGWQVSIAGPGWKRRFWRGLPGT